jgi:hypothetical protein
MRRAKKIAILSLVVLFMMAIYVPTADAQRRYYRRPIIVRQYYVDPFWASRNWWYNDPYFYDPYLRERRERYEREKDVRDARRKLSQDREKYGSDGVITAKEAEKLAKRERDYARAVEKLDKFNRDHS